MLHDSRKGSFSKLNRAYNTVFRSERLSLGLVLPLESYADRATPNMARHAERARLADSLGFSAPAQADRRSVAAADHRGQPAIARRARPQRRRLDDLSARSARAGRVVGGYRQRISKAGLPDKPVMQPLYDDLVAQADAPPSPIHLGFRSGTDRLRRYLMQIRDLGINHVALNLQFTGTDIEDIMQRLADEVLPEFHS